MPREMHNLCAVCVAETGGPKKLQKNLSWLTVQGHSHHGKGVMVPSQFKGAVHHGEGVMVSET